MALRKVSRELLGDINNFRTDKRTAAFWSRVDRRGPDECWPWLGPTTPNGEYGKFDYGPIRTTAHRIAFMLEVGPLEGSRQALHSCDFGLCCNFAHLFAGTQLENIHDMWAKGRQGDVRNFGEKNGRAVLSDGEVSTIRKMHAFGETQTALAGKYGVSITQIHQIVHGRQRRPRDAAQ